MTDTHTFNPTWASPPGDTVADLLAERGLTQADLAERTGYTRKHINDVVRGRAAISYEAALKLETVLGSTADFWMRREVQYREALARQELNRQFKASAPWLGRLPLASMVKSGWVERFPDKGQQVAACLRFFGVASVEAWETTYSEPLLAFRKSARASTEGPAAAAWLRQGELLAGGIATGHFDVAGLRERLTELRRLTLITDQKVFVPALTALCAEVGVAVVLVPTLPGCPATGATRWLTPAKALLMLSDRYRTHDVLWFTFFHELCHLLHHSKKMTVIEGGDGLDARLEDEADTFAANLLIPPADARRLADLPRDARAIAAFAREIGVAPGIVLGRMQKDGLVGWSRCGELKVRYEFRAQRAS